MWKAHAPVARSDAARALLLGWRALWENASGVRDVAAQLPPILDRAAAALEEAAWPRRAEVLRVIPGGTEREGVDIVGVLVGGARPRDADLWPWLRGVAHAHTVQA